MNKQSKLRRWLRSDWVVLPCFLALMFAARSSLADHYYVPSGSMEYTIMTGDRVLIDKTAYGLEIPFTGIEAVAIGEPARGDVVVFDSPADATRLIKRVVATGGDVVTLRDGLLSVNGERPADAGEKLANSDAVASGSPGDRDTADALEIFGEHRAQLKLAAGGGPGVEPMTIPAGRVLVLGDNRGDSIDSRYFGLIDTGVIYGRALGVYYRRGEGLTWHAL